MFELGLLVNWSLNLSRAYDNSMQFSAADCIGNCLDATTCNGAVYDAATYECYRFASCGSTCLVASAVSDSYRLYCRQGNVDVSRDARKPTTWFLNRCDTNRAVQAQKMARGWKFGFVLFVKRKQRHMPNLCFLMTRLAYV